jgi:hypothetical protein
MKVRCLHNIGEALRPYENSFLKSSQFGRFGASAHTQYGVEIGKEYLVMGMLMGEGSLSYLVDSMGEISIYPYPLFEVIDNSINSNWFFRAFKIADGFFPYQEAIWGYKELVFDESHYEKLIEGEEVAQRIYFRRKSEFEKELEEQKR